MIKKSILLVVCVISICISCSVDKKSKTALEGTWIASYMQTANNGENGFKHTADYIHLMDFKGNTLRLKSFNAKKSKRYIDTIVNFSLTDNTIKLGDEAESQINITTDSIVFSSEMNDQTYQNVYRKLPENSKNVRWNPSGKLYKTKYDEVEIVIDFANDSIVYGFDNETGQYNTSHWSVENIENYTLFIFRNDDLMEIDYTVIDSLVGNKIYLSDYFLNKKSTQVLQEVEKSHKKPATLYGTWKLVYKQKLQTDTKKMSVPSVYNNLDKLHINKDSIKFDSEPFKTFSYWKYYENVRTILLEKPQKTIKVSKVTKDSLVLKMNLSDTDFLSREYIFIRE